MYTGFGTNLEQYGDRVTPLCSGQLAFNATKFALCTVHTDAASQQDFSDLALLAQYEVAVHLISAHEPGSRKRSL